MVLGSLVKGYVGVDAIVTPLSIQYLMLRVMLNFNPAIEIILLHFKRHNVGRMNIVLRESRTGHLHDHSHLAVILRRLLLAAFL